MASSGKIQKPKEFTETRKLMLSYFCMLVAISFLSVYTYGFRALNIILVSVLTTVGTKKICEEILKSEYPNGDLSGLVTGLLIALLLPATVPYYIPFFAGFFAVIVCMLPFGTAKNSPFIPAAAAFCFVALCFGEKVFSYPEIINGVYKAEKIGTSLTGLLSSGTSIRLNSAVALEILTGQTPNALGTGFIIMLLGALIFLIIRYPKNSVAPLMFLVSASIFSIAFPRVRTGALTSFTMEICGGMLIFSAVFFMSSPSVAPTRTISAAIWGFVSGIICMAFRYFGKFDDSVVFGILVMNATSGLFDEIPLLKFEKKKLEDNTPYEEISEPEGIVPEEILNEIPDISDEEIIAQEEEKYEVVIADDLHTVVHTENDIQDGDTPLDLGGDGNE